MENIDNYSKACGQRIAKLLKSKNMRQYEIADLLPFRPAMVSHYINGVKILNVEAVIAFCNALQCQPIDIDPERRFYNLNVKSRSELDRLLDRVPAENIALLEQLATQLAVEQKK